MSIKALIVDEEFPARQELRYILEEIGNVEIVAEFTNGLDVLSFVQTNDADVIFLDIELPIVSGLSIAEKILQMKKPPKIVFSTGFSEFAVQAFALGGTDYVLKPYTKERLEMTISRLTKKEESTKITNENLYVYNNPMAPAKLALWSNDRLLLLDPETEVFFFKAENRKTQVFTKKGVLETSQSLKELEERFRKNRFMRIHKSYIVNTAFIKEVIPWFNDTYILKLSEYAEEDIPVSRHFWPEFKKHLQLK